MRVSAGLILLNSRNYSEIGVPWALTGSRSEMDWYGSSGIRVEVSAKQF
jgi:hypothetical protein